MEQYRQIVLASRPKGVPVPNNFRLETGAVPSPAEGQLLLRTQYLSLDPYMRGRMNAAESYAAPVEVGEVMEGEVIAEILASRHPHYRQGELVQAKIGWRTHAAVAPETVRRVETRGNAPTTALGVLGMPGFTAFSGMRVIGRPSTGETVVVAAATGPVGSLVGQLAKRVGARAIGIASGAAKCAYIRDQLRFDVAIDRNSGRLSDALAWACPDGIDVYFENVGGPVWDAVLPLLNRYARVPVCGLIAHYNAAQSPPGPTSAEVMQTVLRRSVLIRGFINAEFATEHYDAFLEEVGPLVKSGDIRYREEIVDGLEAAPNAFVGMLAGRNFGKLLVRVH
ncbi:NADP-dependent oxidoreductase [Mesorhizobium kowhaii]|uniref:NADP-dependent oxidoreductase n=1 Tax=Mesorhizobium kowhaii TaxID=1300272 RepID=UPI001FE15DEF|nr:NADP-dependent oxidoreductase [Mesorhizobium kowhaii]